MGRCELGPGYVRLRGHSGMTLMGCFLHLIRPGSRRGIVSDMIIHRYLRAHYQQVPVYFWPILFFELWRVDRWTAETGRQAFVMVDRYGRAWVPYFEGMARNFAAYDIATRFYSPSDVDDLCPDIFEQALATLTVDACESRGPGTVISNRLSGTSMPWIPATQSSWARRFAGIGGGGDGEYLEPG